MNDQPVQPRGPSAEDLFIIVGQLFVENRQLFRELTELRQRIAAQTEREGGANGEGPVSSGTP